MSDNLRSLVRQFHEAMGTPPFSDLNRVEREALVALRAELISEEGQELRQADEAYRRDRTNEQLLQLAKEMADLLYVVVGTSDLLRTSLTDLPMAKAEEHTQLFAGGRVLQLAAKIIDSLHLLGHQVIVGWDRVNLSKEVAELGSELQDVVHSVIIMAKAYGIPIYEVFEAVHASNMTKVGSNPVFRADGKLLKGSTYKDPDLDFLLKTAA